MVHQVHLPWASQRFELPWLLQGLRGSIPCWGPGSQRRAAPTASQVLATQLSHEQVQKGSCLSKLSIHLARDGLGELAAAAGWRARVSQGIRRGCHAAHAGACPRESPFLDAGKLVLRAVIPAGSSGVGSTLPGCEDGFARAFPASSNAFFSNVPKSAIAWILLTTP